MNTDATTPGKPPTAESKLRSEEDYRILCESICALTGRECGDRLKHGLGVINQIWLFGDRGADEWFDSWKDMYDALLKRPANGG